jgi:hypothetical protein
MSEIGRVDDLGFGERGRSWVGVLVGIVDGDGVEVPAGGM